MNENRKKYSLILILGIPILLILIISGYYIFHSRQKPQSVMNQNSKTTDDSDYSDTIVAQWGQNNNEWNNQQFGFKLKFSDSWQGLKIIENSAVFDNAIGSYSIDVPKQSALLNISVYKIEDWSNPAKDDQGQIIYPDNKLIGKTDKYAISYRFYNSIDGTIKSRYNALLPDLIKTFEAESVQIGQKTYENKTLGITFKYPANWIEKQTSNAQSSWGIITYFDDPATVDQNDFEVDHWASINDYNAKGVQYAGQPEYKNLSDYFKDSQACNKKLSEISLSNTKGYLVQRCGEGSNLAVMFENNGLFEFSFNNNIARELTPEQKDLINSINFY